MTRCFLFYEDKEVQAQNFGPHRLLCSCVADLVGIESRSLQEGFIALKPCAGVTKQVKAIVESAPLLLKNNVVFAVFDADKIREQLGIQPAENVFEALKLKGVPPDVRVFLLEQNTESLLQAVLNCEHQMAPSKSTDLPKKKAILRDKILNRAADAAPQIRDCVLGKVPSFKAIVDEVAAALSEEAS